MMSVGVNEEMKTKKAQNLLRRIKSATFKLGFDRGSLRD